MATPRTFRLHELGCKVNQWEGQWFREGLKALGLHEAGAEETADIFVVNSCSVTESGGSKSRHSVRHFVRRNPSAKVLVTGCYAESDKDIVEALPGVVKTFGNQEKAGIVPWVARSLLGMDGELPELPQGISEFAGHTRAFVKIQDGCRDNCSFCIIPSLRGEIMSRPHNEILEEVKRLVASGYKEVVLTGVHLGYFGWDRQEKNAVYDLLKDLAQVSGLKRLKLSSIEVHEITESLADLFASSEVFVPHFHLPLQAGTDEVLRIMRRKYSVGRFRDAVAMLRDRLDTPAITTDLIVGHPGETDVDFDNSMAFCREMAFSKMHIFPYSPRQNTAAAGMTNHVHDAEISRRKKVAAELDDMMALNFRQHFCGTTAPVLVEGHAKVAGGMMTGLTDRFLRVDFEGSSDTINEIVPVQLDNAETDRMIGHVTKKEAMDCQ